MRLQLQNVSKRYGRKQVLEGITMEVPPGTVVALVGLNGAGKSTLLNTVAGVIAPTSGHVEYDGTPLRREDLALRRRFFFVPDEPVLFYDQTVLRNLATILHLYEADAANAEERVADLLEEFDLLAVAQQPVANLSRGQIYKVGLVALIATDAELWILDEPFASGMDPLGLKAMRRHLREAVARERSVLLTTQLVEVAQKVADRVGILHEGELRAYGPLAELQTRAASTDEPLSALLEQFREEEHASS